MRTLHAFMLGSLIVATIFCLGAEYQERKDRQKRIKLAENAYGAGCNWTAMQLCGQLRDEPRDNCFSTAIKICDKDAETFRKTIFGQ